MVAGSYVGLRKHERRNLSDLASKRFWLAESIAFFVLLAAGALSLRSASNPDYRSPTHLVTSSLLFVVIALEAVSLPKAHVIELAVLAQATLASLWVRLAPQLASPGVIGIDSWFHAGVVREIAQSGFIPTDNIYHGLPNFHILAVAFGYVGGSQDLRFLELLGPIVGALGCVFIYLVGRWLHGGRVGLLGTAFYGFGGYLVAMDFSFLAFALGATLLVASFYLCLRYIERKSVGRLISVIVTMVALVGTHTVMAFTLFVMLSVLWIARQTVPILRGRRPSVESKFPGSLPAFFGVALFSWWGYVSGSLFNLAGLLRWGFGYEPFSPAPSSFPYSVQVPDGEYLLNLMVFLAPLGFAFLGSIPLLSKRGQSSTQMGVLAATWTLAAVGVTSSVPQLIGLLGLRWNLAFQLFSGPMAGLGLLWVVSLARRRTLALALVILVVAPIAFVSVSSPAGNQDTNVFSPNTFVRLSLTESELASLSHVSSMHAPTFYALFPDYSYLEFYAHVDAVDLAPFLVTHSTDRIPNGLIVLSSSAATSPVYYRQTTVTLNYNPLSTLALGYSKIYDSGSISAFETNV